MDLSPVMRRCHSNNLEIHNLQMVTGMAGVIWDKGIMFPCQTCRGCYIQLNLTTSTCWVQMICITEPLDFNCHGRCEFGLSTSNLGVPLVLKVTGCRVQRVPSCLMVVFMSWYMSVVLKGSLFKWINMNLGFNQSFEAPGSFLGRVIHKMHPWTGGPWKYMDTCDLGAMGAGLRREESFNICFIPPS